MSLIEEILDRQKQLHEATLDLLEATARKRDVSRKLRIYRQFQVNPQRQQNSK